MLVDQEASICQLNSNICPAKIAQRKQAKKTKVRVECATANQEQSSKPHLSYPPRQPPKQKTHEVDDHRQCQHTKKNCPTTQEFKKSLRVNRPSHNQESRQNRRELTLQPCNYRKNNTPE